MYYSINHNHYFYVNKDGKLFLSRQDGVSQFIFLTKIFRLVKLFLPPLHYHTSTQDLKSENKEHETWTETTEQKTLRSYGRRGTLDEETPRDQYLIDPGYSTCYFGTTKMVDSDKGTSGSETPGPGGRLSETRSGNPNPRGLTGEKTCISRNPAKPDRRTPEGGCICLVGNP